MTSGATPELPATIIHTEQGPYCCSACRGFVRQDARICKHCNRSFGRGGPEAPPAMWKVLLSLIGAGLIVGLFGIGGILVYEQIWPSARPPINFPPSIIGGLIGARLGILPALISWCSPCAVDSSVRTAARLGFG
jgi:hypothetical protein